MRVEERIGAEAAASQSAATSEAQKTRKPSSAGATGTGGASADSAQLSTLAGRIRERLEAIGSDHTARVERLAAEVRTGRYRMDVAALSRALVSEALGGAEL